MNSLRADYKNEMSSLISCASNKFKGASTIKKFLTFFIFFLLTNTATAKENLMKCSNTSTLIVVDRAFDKKLYFRKDGEWKDWCEEDEIHKFKHKGDSASCIIKVPSSYKQKKQILNTL